MSDITLKDINRNGVKYLNSTSPEDINSLDVDKIRLCIEFTEKFMEPSKVKTYNSYHLKHVVEKWSNRYISNGDYIAAALCMGLRVKPYNMFNNPNAAIYVMYKTKKLRRFFEYGAI